jgi:DNA-binding NarL/FixJ family response regulator
MRQMFCIGTRVARSAREGAHTGEGCLVSVRVLVVDDHAAMRRCLTQVLESETDITVVGEASSGDAAVLQVEQLEPDVVIMDVGMSALNGMDATRRIVQHRPQTIVIALSVHDYAMYAAGMLRAGARAYVLKDGGGEELIRAMRIARRGRTYLSSGIEGLNRRDAS